MVESEGQATAALEARRILQFGDQKVALAELRADGPSGLWVAINGVLGAVIELLPVGGGFGEKEIGLGRPRAGLGPSAEGELVEDEVAGLAPAPRTFFRQAGVGQYFEQNGGDAG